MTNHGVRDYAAPRLDKFQRDGKGDQKNNHPFQNLHAPGRGLIRNFFVDAFQRLQFAQDALIPLVEMKAPVDHAIDPRQILIADQLQRVIDAFE